MRPSKIKPGRKLKIQLSLGGSEGRIAYFVKRVPAQCGRKAENYLRFPDFAGLDGSDDNGTCVMSDYDLSRNGKYA